MSADLPRIEVIHELPEHELTCACGCLKHVISEETSEQLDIVPMQIGAALGMKVEDVYTQNRRLWVRLREKGGKQHAMPCHHTLEAYLHAYLVETGIEADLKGPLFRTIQRGTGQLSATALPQANAHAMVRRRALAAGIKTPIGNHSFRATGITAYLKNGGTLENAAAMANHASTRTTQLYDRRRDEISLDEVERIHLM